MKIIGLLLGIGCGSTSGTPGVSNGEYYTQSGDIRLLFLPDSFHNTAGVIDGVTDQSAYGNDVDTIAGSPALASGTPGAGVAFDGVNDALAGSLSMPADQPSSLWLLADLKVTDTGGDPIFLFNASDTGAADRSLVVQQRNTELDARQGQAGDNAATGFSPVTTGLQLLRFDYRTGHRAIWRNGVWMAASSISGLPVRAPTSYRFGAYIAADAYFAEYDLFAAALVAWPGTGALAEHDFDRRKIEDELLTLGGLPTPPRAPLPTVAVPADPGWMIDNVVINAIVGQQVQVFKDTVLEATGDVGQEAVWSGGRMDRRPSDRWAFTPTVAGDTTLIVTAGAHTATATIRAVAALHGGAAKRYGLLFGDSWAQHAAMTWAETLANTLTSSKWAFVGSLGPDAPYSQAHDGRAGWGTATYLAPGSPIVNGGGDLDVDPYLLSLSHLPDDVIFSLPFNDVVGTGAGAEAALAAALARLDTIVQAFRASLPSARIYFLTPEPLASDPATWTSGASERNARHHEACLTTRGLIEQYGGREAEGYYVIHKGLVIDGFDDYSKTDHSHSIGAERPAAAVLAALTSGWP